MSFFSVDMYMHPLTGAGALFHREEEELYVLHLFCTSVEVGDDLTGSKVSENSSKRRRRGRNIRETSILTLITTSSRIRCTVTAPRFFEFE